MLNTRRARFRSWQIALGVLTLQFVIGVYAQAQEFAAVVRPFTQKYCIKCHGDRKQEAELTFTKYRAEKELLANRKLSTAVLKMLRTNMMPPEGHPQPTRKERDAVVGWLEAKLTQIDCRLQNDPGRVTVRRLNRAEYDNTVRDLIGVDLKLARDFPSDDVGEGFDNIGDVLSISPLHFEKYIIAAEKIVDAAILTSDPTQAPSQFSARGNLVTRGGRLDDYGVYHLTSSGSVLGYFTFPREGEYLLRTQAGAQQAGPEVAKMAVRIDNKPAKTFDVKAPSDDMAVHEVRIRVSKGKKRVAAAFINDYYKPNDPDPNQRDRNLYIKSIEVVGPLDFKPDNIPASHQRIVIARPGEKKSVQRAALEVLQPFMSRAFRRSVLSIEVAPYASLVDLAVKKGDTYERGIQVAVTAVLVSPQFLFRVERDPEPNNANRKHPLTDFELATRLSYFLWSSMPDEELFALARKSELHQDVVLRQQIKRMLADPKAFALAENFGGQWLNLRNLDEAMPDPKVFPTFNDQLRKDMVRETQSFFVSIMQEDSSILDFLDGDYTFINQRLARHYGLDGVSGDRFQKVSLSNTPRAGVLTHASILTLTSDPTRTSPVKRGKWVMENLLGTPLRDPPANVPELAEIQKSAPDLPLRKQFELHRTNPTCAVCHRSMDPLGFGLENFDAIGRWRKMDGKHLIDSSGTLPNGDSFGDPKELTKILRKRQDQFSRFLAEKMLTYALGRGLRFQDRCAVDDIVKSLKNNDYRFSALVTEIVTSEPFRMRRGDGGEK